MKDAKKEGVIRSLDAHYYTSPDIYKNEQAGLFASSWQFVCHVSQVEKPGDYFAFSLAGEDLFLIRDSNQELRCFYNVCQHRAHQLVKGKGNLRVIVCPYHAWTYELSGGLRGGPNTNAVKGFDKSTICLTSAKVDVFLGFVFVNLDKNAKPMDDWFPNARNELQEWVPNFAQLKPIEWVEIAEKCNWKVSVENYSECYHCSLNHPTFSKGVVKPETYDIQPQGYCLRHQTECSDLDQMTYDIRSGFDHWDQYSSWFLWPMFSFQVYPGNVLNTYHWRPIDHENVVLWRGWFSVDGQSTPYIHKLARQDRLTTVAEDITLVESVQRGLNSKGYVPGPLVLDPKCGVMSEHSVMHLQKWMREAITTT